VRDAVTTRTLAVLRHGDAAEGALGGADADRPLTPAGRRRAAGRRPAVLAAAPQLVLCSPAVRTRQTLEALGDLDAEVRLDPRIYAAAGGDLRDLLADVGDEVTAVLLVGHMPGVAELVAGLLAPGPPPAFRPAALAHLAVAADWAALVPGCARLVAHHP
jgi:phosphohistidine phosphatase